MFNAKFTILNAKFAVLFGDMSKPDIEIDKKGKTKAFVKRKPGKQCTLNDELISKICNNLRLGTNINTACVMAGVDSDTFLYWIRRAHKDRDTIYGDLLRSVEKAQEESTVRDLQLIDKCAFGTPTTYIRGEQGQILWDEKGRPMIDQMGTPPNPSLAQWRLSKRRPRDWGNVIHIDEALEPRLSDKEEAKASKERKELIARHLETLKLIE